MLSSSVELSEGGRVAFGSVLICFGGVSMPGRVSARVFFGGIAVITSVSSDSLSVSDDEPELESLLEVSEDSDSVVDLITLAGGRTGALTVQSLALNLSRNF